MSSFPITDLKAIEIIDNRGMPTIRVFVCVDQKHWGSADVPSGSSTGSYEALEIRDGDARYNGKGVRKAIQTIDEIIFPRIVGMDVTCQCEIDHQMLALDGTANKSNLGGNTILGVSLAASRAASIACGLPLYQYLNRKARVLPVPQACLINGGLHAGNDLDIQEYCVMPVGAETFTEAVRFLCETFICLKEILNDDLGRSATNSSEDGGFAPPISSTRQAMDYLIKAVENAGISNQVVYGLDFAATEFYDQTSGKYTFEGSEWTSGEMIRFIQALLKAYPPIVSIEDPLYEDDFEGMKVLTKSLEEKLVIGDDMFATNIERIQKGIDLGAANSVLCKVNQIGTLTEAFEAADFARRNRYTVVVSERSGETEDSILSDISVAMNAGLFKTGGLRGSDRGTNYNRFMEIETELGSAAVYAGIDYRLDWDRRTHGEEK